MCPFLFAGRFTVSFVLPIAPLFAILFIATSANAGEVILRNGTVLEGTAVGISGLSVSQKQAGTNRLDGEPIIMVESTMRRYFVPRRQVASRDPELSINRYETFEIPQPGIRRTGWTPTSLGSFTEVTEFDKFGRRRVTVATPKGPEHIIQGITEINSKFVTIKSLSHDWTFALATTSIPAPILDRVLRNILDPDNPEDRMAVVRFLIESGRYIEAAGELDAIKTAFPDLAARIKKLELSLRNETARRLLIDLRRRRETGQHDLAYRAARQFPRARMEADVLREVDELLTDHAETRNEIETVHLLLAGLHADVADADRRAAIEPLRQELRRQLDPESLSRMTAFLTLESDETLPAESKLALAYSGWLLGESDAITNLDATINLLKARYLILDYLRSDDPAVREKAYESLLNLESVPLERVARLIEHLGPIRDAGSIPIGTPTRVVVPDPSSTGREVAYWVTLPMEYTPTRDYPLIICLGPPERTAEREAYWWGGDATNALQAQRHGYIVVSPEYLGKAKKYDASAASQFQILDCLRDARLRFRVDSDRVFLAGHGVGGDAAFDVGLSHPDLFAGVIPICGQPDRIAKWYWKNGDHTSFYIIAGERDRQILERHGRNLNEMMRHGHDVIYVEYIGRGYESYYAEIHKLFDWMSRQKRKTVPTEIDARILRPTDASWYWVELHGLPRNVLESEIFSANRSRPVRPFELDVQMKSGLSDRVILYVRPVVDRVVIYLAPDYFDFQKRLRVHLGSRQVFNNFVETDLRVMLDDLRARGDRQTLRWAKLEL